MTTSESRNRATINYLKKHDRLTIRVPKGKREEYKNQAQKRGMSLQAYVVKLLEES